MISRAFVVLIAAFLAASMDASASSPRKAALRDFDGDGRTDLLWQKDGGYAVWTMNGVAIQQANVVTAISGTLRFTGDFDGDGKTDLLMRDPDGRHVVYFMDGLSVRGSKVVVGPGLDWEAIAVGDFDGDGRADIAWKTGTGTVAISSPSPQSLLASAVSTGRSDLSVVAVADFDGNGTSDILWSAADGSVHLTSFGSFAITATRKLIDGGSGWWPAAVGDFNGDGHADIVWRHPDGRHALWSMDDPLAPRFIALLDAGTAWSVAFVRDLDGDGRSDLVWRNTNGSYAAWLMDGGGPKAYGVLLDAGTGWSVIGSGDFDGDGRDDLVFRSQDGSYAIWLMDGLRPKAYRQLFAGGTGWEAGPATAGCDRTVAGDFTIVNPNGGSWSTSSSGRVYVERTAGACGGAFTVTFNATFTPSSGDSSGYAPLGGGQLSFADGEPGIKVVPVQVGAAEGTYRLDLAAATGAGVSTNASGSAVRNVFRPVGCVAFEGPYTCGGGSTADYLLPLANNTQIVFGSTETASNPPLLPGQTIAAYFVFNPAGGGGAIEVEPVINYIAGPAVDLEISIASSTGTFPATGSDTLCSRRIPAAQFAGQGIAALYAGSWPGACALTPGQLYFANIRQVSANYTDGTTPSCTSVRGCALRIQPWGLD